MKITDNFTRNADSTLISPVLQNFFESGVIDRLAEQRKNEKWLHELLNHKSVRIIPVWRDMHLVDTQNSEQPVAVFPTYEEWRTLHPHITPEILLGKNKENGAIYFAVELQELEQEKQAAYAHLGEFQSLRNISLNIDKHEGSLMAYAQGMTIWHRNHRFCGKCGFPTRNSEGGHIRLCTSETCQSPHFPRTDPAVIVLVTAGDYCLLGRSLNWRQGVYSTIAGFVEPGESLEMTVMREVLEETGVHVERSSITYHSSQPWPFPASIMLGFTAQAEMQEIHLDPDELEDARWFSRNDIEQELAAGSFCLPSKFSIAYRLIEDWRSQ